MGSRQSCSKHLQKSTMINHNITTARHNNPKSNIHKHITNTIPYIHITHNIQLKQHIYHNSHNTNSTKRSITYNKSREVYPEAIPEATERDETSEEACGGGARRTGQVARRARNPAWVRSGERRLGSASVGTKTILALSDWRGRADGGRGRAASSSLARARCSWRGRVGRSSADFSTTTTTLVGGRAWLTGRGLGRQG